MNKIVEIALRLPVEEAEKWSIALSNTKVCIYIQKCTTKFGVTTLMKNVLKTDNKPIGYHVCGETKDGYLVCVPNSWL